MIYGIMHQFGDCPDCECSLGLRLGDRMSNEQAIVCPECGRVTDPEDAGHYVFASFIPAGAGVCRDICIGEEIASELINRGEGEVIAAIFAEAFPEYAGKAFYVDDGDVTFFFDPFLGGNKFEYDVFRYENFLTSDFEEDCHSFYSRRPEQR